jgi:GH15 family glucan-1,4-alpha-glucosidase
VSEASARTFDQHRYPLIGEYALIGDCQTAALITRTAAIEWCCLPRFDSGSAFARILDRDRGGHCSIAPTANGDWHYTRRYIDDTLILETTLTGPAGEARITDLFVVRDPDDEHTGAQILRVIDGVRGAVEFDVRIAARFDYGQVRPWLRSPGRRLRSVIGGNDALIVFCDAELTEDAHHDLVTRLTVAVGDRTRLLMVWCPPERVDDDGLTEPSPRDLDAALEQTHAWWTEWSKTVTLHSRDEAGARRSAIVLKALTYRRTGAVVAAPTTSLPEARRSSRNWDYRFAWIRDSSFSSRAFAELGCQREANAFREFVMRSAAGHADDLQVMYGVGGERRIGEQQLDELDGYDGARPVRVGNDAKSQVQLDAYGELVNLSWRWHRRGHSPTDDEWRFLVSIIDHAAEHCAEPDCGIWEWPGEPEHFVHSKVMCWAALDRGIRLARECMRRAPTRRWAHVRDELRRTIEANGYDAERGVFTQTYGRPELDAALLLLPTVEFIDWHDERMIRTTHAVREELDAGDGLIYRYRRGDGLEGEEGAFLCCSFWLAECLAEQGDHEGARAVFDATLGRANDLGLFSEQFDPVRGELLGNFPQGLTHLAHIDAATCLATTQPPT